MVVVILKDKAKYVCVAMDIHNSISSQANLSMLMTSFYLSFNRNT